MSVRLRKSFFLVAHRSCLRTTMWSWLSPSEARRQPTESSLPATRGSANGCSEGAAQVRRSGARATSTELEAGGSRWCWTRWYSDREDVNIYR